MPPFSPHALGQVLESALPHDVRRLCVALSGGLDSSVLLHALHSIRESHSQWSLRALHIDHQLQSSSQRWSEECARIAAHFAVPFECKRVHVRDAARSGVEAAARKVRYAAFQDALADNEALLTAHHADDQLETVLLALMRGSGVSGLAAMPISAPLGRGIHVRPLLNFTRAEIEAWAAGQGIAGIHDPSNDEVRFDRNFLRHSLIPTLKQRWPSAARSVSRSASHFADADRLLDELAEADFARACVGDCLQVSALRSLSVQRRRNLLRYWIHRNGFLMPSTRKLAALEQDMLVARIDSMPCVEWEGAQVRRYDDLLYLTTPLIEISRTLSLDWELEKSLDLPASLGSLQAVRREGAGLAVARLPQTLRVRFRHGGEAIKPRHARHHRRLKHLLQDARVLPWWRNRIPLVYAGHELIAVADLWIDDAWAAREHERAVKIVWQDKPAITGETRT